MKHLSRPIIALILLGGAFSASMGVLASVHILTVIFVFFLIFTVGGITQDMILPHATSSSFFLPLLTGVVVTSSTIYLLLFLAPLVHPTTIILSFTATWLILLFVKQKNLQLLGMKSLDTWEITALIVSLAASLLWNQESLSPWISERGQIIFIPWIDSFYHAAWISALTRAPHVGYIQDIRTIGSTQYFYHAAQYVLPAFFSFVCKISPLKTYLSFLVPISMFLLGGTAFCLGNFFKDTRAGFLATVITLLLPSAAILGPRMYWFDFHWILAISPSLSLGITSIALSYIFLIQSCSEKSYLKVIASWGFSLLSITTKFHLFAVNSPFLLLGPLFLLPGLKRSLRFVIVLLVSLVFVIAICIVNSLGLSIFNFDGTAFNWYSHLLLSLDKVGVLKNLLNITLSTSPTITTILKMSCFILLGSFGALLLFWLSFASFLIKEYLLLTYMTLFSIGTYLLFSLSGSISSSTFGNPEEFMHRPFVWSYFLLCVGGALILSKLTRKLEKSLILTLSLLSLMIPYSLGKDVLSGPHFGLNMIALPEGLLNATKYLKDHTSPNDSFFITDKDPHWIASALSERQLFAQDSGNKNFRKLELLDERLTKISELLNPLSIEHAHTHLKDLNVDWLVVTPDLYEDFKGHFQAPLMYESNNFLVFKIT